MNKTLKNKGSVLVALLLSAVLSVTLLIKPVHILLVHHELTEITQVHSDRIVFTTVSHPDCPICDYEFCSFISTSPIDVPKVSIAFATELTPGTIDCPVDQPFHYFQLRAPPVA